MATIEQPPAADDKDFAEVVVTKDESGDVADRRQFMFFTENVTPNLGLKMSMSRILFSGKSKFQTVDIIENGGESPLFVYLALLTKVYPDGTDQKKNLVQRRLQKVCVHFSSRPISLISFSCDCKIPDSAMRP